jgi:hypothetical protein
MQENRVPRGMRHKTRINIEVFGPFTTGRVGRGRCSVVSAALSSSPGERTSC